MIRFYLKSGENDRVTYSDKTRCRTSWDAPCQFDSDTGGYYVGVQDEKVLTDTPLNPKLLEATDSYTWAKTVELRGISAKLLVGLNEHSYMEVPDLDGSYTCDSLSTVVSLELPGPNDKVPGLYKYLLYARDTSLDNLKRYLAAVYHIMADEHWSSEPQEDENLEVTLETEVLHRKLNIPTEAIPLRGRAHDDLFWNMDIQYMGDLVQMSACEVLGRVKNRKKCLNKVEQLLYGMGLHFSMSGEELKGWKRPKTAA